MERYLGGDVHAASVTFSVLNESGKQLRRDVVETNGQALVGYLKQQPGNLHLCIEEGEWSQWLYEILSPHVAELVVYRGQWQPGPKSDARPYGRLPPQVPSPGCGEAPRRTSHPRGT
ncbi:MAG: IS110 family transposase [Akkermansiaceae bacterium]|nr:IS110 family transposase [Akkermansiaceae bacterium]